MISLFTEGNHELHVPESFSFYHILSVLGRGSFSVVFRVQNARNKKEFACKVMRDEDSLYLEKSPLFHLSSKIARHPNLIYIEEIIHQNGLTFIIMEHCVNGEVFNYIRNNSDISARSIQLIFYQVTSALSFLHSRNIAHRDIKPENVLLDRSMVGKLCDFGFATDTSAREYASTPCGSTYYAAPEIVLGKRYDAKLADIWSLGVLLYFMRFGTIPWHADSVNELARQIEEGDFTLPPCERPIADVILACLRVDPYQRPSAHELLLCEYLQSVEDCNTTAMVGMSPLVSSRKLNANMTSTSKTTATNLTNATNQIMKTNLMTQKIVPKMMPKAIIPKKVARSAQGVQSSLNSPNASRARLVAPKNCGRRPFF